ncbi:DUF4247 domain-containing protein [Pilimelia columellifera]|uniref:DUF4247 domain-containing protein n=1 Tax=Pilimelia columellifera subsp. columellifera TaxID=706583 RepID=A0ABP6A327_9ACTN
MNPRAWQVVAGLLAAVGLVVAGFALLHGGGSPRGFVADRYVRASGEDIGDQATAYTSTRRPSQVAKDVTNAWRPADEFTDGSGVYLRYADDAVVILPAAEGSLVLVEKVVTAYPRHRARVGGAWGWGRGVPALVSEPAR